jgi:hypothetical protein
MPSSPGYKRDYAQELVTLKKRGEDKLNLERKRARYALQKAGKVKPHDGKDVGHVKALKRGGTNAPSNLQVQDDSANRSFARNKDGSMKSEASKRERNGNR